MLPAKIGDGVLGSSSGGVNPAGASFGGAGVGASAAVALMVKGRWGSLRVVVVVVVSCLRVVMGLERGGVKRVA